MMHEEFVVAGDGYYSFRLLSSGDGKFYIQCACFARGDVVWTDLPGEGAFTERDRAVKLIDRLRALDY